MNGRIFKLQDLIDAVESLLLEDQFMLAEIINRHTIEKRREKLVAEVKESQEAFERGEVRRGTVKDLIKDLFILFLSML